MPRNSLNKRMLADLALLFCALIWGATFVAVKDALADVSVFVYLAVRFAIAAAAVGLIFWRTVREIRLPTMWAGIQIGFFMLGGYAFQTTGLEFTTPSKAAFITGSSVVIVPLLLAAFGRGRVNAWIWTGAVLALAGLYFLTIPKGEGLGGLNRGDPIVFGGAVMFALHIIFISRYVGKHSAVALSFVQISTTAVVAALALPFLSEMGYEVPQLRLTGTVIFATLVTALGSTAIGFTFQNWAQQYTSPSHTAIFISLEPVFAILTSWVMASERLTGRLLFGAGLILLGILIAELKGPAPAVPESPEPIAHSLE
ncbi:MAG TPA: DMT family transporter [Candidatus Acidoferrum sp.]|nr:DMT family transporter [Candidatus Acidoferrum sp.]